MATMDAAGSWFPTGYYGHFRSKSRNDFICEYRQLAKPQPPKKFINRSVVHPHRHVFSTHDNRQAFLNDALYFEQGLGRKRAPNRSYAYNPEFIAWRPSGKKSTEYLSSPEVSTYKLNFQDGVPTGRVAQLIVKRPATSFDGIATSTYRYAHGNAQPNMEAINAMNNAAFLLTAKQREQRAVSTRPSSRESVATCMSWHIPEPPKKMRAPIATQTTDFTQTSTNISTMSDIHVSHAVSAPASLTWPLQTIPSVADAE